MPREVQRYVTSLLETVLGPAEIEKRFDWARGDSRDPSRRGVPLPFDAVWEGRKLVVEIDERQHGVPVDFFDKPNVMTVSGVHRGEQRRLYDERKVRLAREHGYTVLRISARALSMDARTRARERDVDRSAIVEILRSAGLPLVDR
jgi:hypothetical protein